MSQRKSWIARPRVVVAVYASDPNHAPAWYVNIKGVEWKTPPPLGVGSRIAFVAQFLGKRMAYAYEVVEFVANERFIMRTAEGPFPMETTDTWASTPESGTRKTLRNRGMPGFSRLMAPFMAGAMRRANQKDLAALNRILEDPSSVRALGPPRNVGNAKCSPAQWNVLGYRAPEHRIVTADAPAAPVR